MLPPRSRYGATKLVLLVTAAVVLPVSSAWGANASVSVVDDAFTPADVSIATGESVTWTWRAGGHNVRVTEGPVRFDSGFKDTGAYTRAFTTPGTYRYVCDAHTEMRGSVTVGGGAEPAPAPRAPAAARSAPVRLTSVRVSRLAVLRVRASSAGRLRIRILRGRRVVRRTGAALAAGANRVPLNVRGVRVGRYRLVAWAVDATGRRSARVARRLVVTRAARARRPVAVDPAPARTPAGEPAPAAPDASEDDDRSTLQEDDEPEPDDD